MGVPGVLGEAEAVVVQKEIRQEHGSVRTMVDITTFAVRLDKALLQKIFHGMSADRVAGQIPLNPPALAQHQSPSWIQLPLPSRKLELVSSLPSRPVLNGEGLPGLLPHPGQLHAFPGTYDTPLLPLHP